MTTQIGGQTSPTIPPGTEALLKGKANQQLENFRKSLLGATELDDSWLDFGINKLAEGLSYVYENMLTESVMDMFPSCKWEKPSDATKLEGIFISRADRQNLVPLITDDRNKILAAFSGETPEISLVQSIAKFRGTVFKKTYLKILRDSSTRIFKKLNERIVLDLPPADPPLPPPPAHSSSNKEVGPPATQPISATAQATN